MISYQLILLIFFTIVILLLVWGALNTDKKINRLYKEKKLSHKDNNNKELLKTRLHMYFSLIIIQGFSMILFLTLLSSTSIFYKVFFIISSIIGILFGLIILLVALGVIQNERHS